MGHDAAHGERLLQPAAERHQLSGRHSAAAVLRRARRTTRRTTATSGATIGHELTHGFDDEGRQFDANGNLRDWWTPQDGKEFEQRASCISDQYSQYVVVDDIKINGQLTMGENVADLGGLMLAYMAWQNHSSRQEAGRDRRLYRRSSASSSAMGRAGVPQTRDETKRMYATIDPALAGQVSCQRGGLQHAGISAGVSVQGGFGDGEREEMQGVVKGRASDLGPQASDLDSDPDCGYYSANLQTW